MLTLAKVSLELFKLELLLAVVLSRLASAFLNHYMLYLNSFKAVIVSLALLPVTPLKAALYFSLLHCKHLQL
ncbi:hypothetical protein OLS72_07385, partial [Campylobacter jejuni]|nr:hypothetical protein [Campylobacter jejuni]